MLATRLSAFLALIALVATFTPGTQAEEKKTEEGWIQLFNGKDLTGWKIPNPPSGQFKGVKETKNDDGKVIAFVGIGKDDKEVTLWQVKDGLIVGGGPASHIFSEIEADDFKYRVEAKINEKGNSGQYFRTKFGPGFPQGYEAQINATGGDIIKTGSLYPGGSLGKYKKDIAVVLNTAPHAPDEFFTQEVIADGNHIVIKVNGKVTLDWEDPDKTFMKGHFAIQQHDPGSKVQVKSIQYKPLKN